MKTTILIFILFCLACNNEPLVRYEKSAVVTFEDETVDTVSMIVYCREPPHFNLSMYAGHVYLAIQKDAAGIARIAIDVKSFREIELNPDDERLQAVPIEDVGILGK